MLADIIKDPKFATVFSLIVGFGIAALLMPLYSKSAGRDFKAPDVKEVVEHVYRLSGKCYEFRAKTLECPGSGSNVIEPFRNVVGGCGCDGTRLPA